MSKKKAKKYVILGNDGIPCPRCGFPTEIRGHSELTEKHLRQPFYYSKWFNCARAACQTTLIMRDEFKVMSSADSAPVARRTEAIEEQLSASKELLYSSDTPPWE